MREPARMVARRLRQCTRSTWGMRRVNAPEDMTLKVIAE